MDKAGDPEEITEACKRLGQQELAGLTWLSLIDPEPRLYTQPPWALRPGLARVGFLDQHGEPKEHIDAWVKGILSSKPRGEMNDFIDISPEEYTADPHTHFPRLWDHFLESS